MLRIGVALVVLGLPLRLDAARAMECIDAATGDKTRVNAPQIQKALNTLQRALKTRGIHVLDLSADAQERHARLGHDQQAKDWCKVRAHVLGIEDALAAVRLDQAFLSDKLGRIQRWAHARVTSAKDREEIDRLLAAAAAHQGEKRFEQANQVLNRVLFKTLGTRDLWQAPADLPRAGAEAEGATAAATVAPGEVVAACPAVAARGSAERADAQAALDRLAVLMDERKLRPLDIKGGEQLTADLASYLNLAAWWPAVRAACALLDRYQKLEVGLGVVMKRFARVNDIRDERGLGDSAREGFTRLVRRASDQIAQRQFGEAHLALEELLVSFGEPSPPSRLLPALP